MRYVILNWDIVVINKFINLGHHPIVVVAWQDISDVPAECARPTSIQVVIAANFTEVSALANLAGQLSQLGTTLQVYSFLESTQYAAAILSSFLNTRSNNPLLTLRTRDKRVMKARLSEFGVPLAKSVAVNKSFRALDAIEAFLKVGAPAIIKPSDGRGSKNISVVKSDAELEAWCTSSVQWPNMDWIFEEFITGTEFHADTVWVSGVARYSLIGRYQRPPRVVADGDGSNATVYIPRSKHQHFYSQVEKLVAKVRSALEIQDGVTHAEFFVRPSGELVFSEIATRPAGGGHDDCVRELLGEGLKELGVRCFLQDFSSAPKADAAYHRTVGFVNLVPSRSGYIERLPRRNDLMEVSGVVNVIYIMQNGQWFEKFGACNWCVMPIVESASINDCFACYTQLRCQFTVDSAPISP